MTDDAPQRPPISLTVNSARVLGCLLEKELTVPSTYPMTMHALITAANQSSGRDPIMAMSEPEVDTALAALRAFGLSRVIHASHGARTTKYRQVADEVLGWERPERAVMTVLLLRGPQTPGELRGRTERLHGFSSSDEVEAVLRALAGRPTPQVELLERQAGQKEARWRHTLMPAALPAAPTAQGLTDVATSAQPSMPAAVPAPTLEGTWVDGDESLVLSLEGDELVVDTLLDGELYERRRWRRNDMAEAHQTR